MSKMQTFKNFEFNLKEKKTPYYIQAIGWIFYAVLFAILLSQAIFSLTHFQAKVYGESMQNTLNSKGGSRTDKVYVNRFRKGEVGDIVVAKDPSGTQIIKRIIAKEGDVLRYEYISEKGYCVLYVNDAIKEESYIKNAVDENINMLEQILPGGLYCVMENVRLNTNGTLAENDDYFEYVVPKDCVFVMGDNRENSKDSRYYGAINVNDISGVVDYILPYGESEINFWFRRTFGF